MRQLLKRDTLYVHFCDLMWVSGLCILWLYFVKVGCLCTLYISIVYCIWYISYSTSIIQDISHHISCVFVYLFTLFCKDFDLVYCIFRWYIVHNGCLYIAQDVFFYVDLQSSWHILCCSGGKMVLSTEGIRRAQYIHVIYMFGYPQYFIIVWTFSGLFSALNLPSLDVCNVFLWWPW